MDAGDNALKEHLKTASHNATYTSKETQNQMIAICGDIVQNQHLLKVQNARYFSVIAYEATDSANNEQLSISVQYNPCEIWVVVFNVVLVLLVVLLLMISSLNRLIGNWIQIWYGVQHLMEQVQWQADQREHFHK